MEMNIHAYKNFLFIPSISYENYKCLIASEQWANTVLSDAGEKGGEKLPIQTFVTGLMEYKNTGKISKFLDLFWKQYESFNYLKRIMKRGKLRALASKIEMLCPDKNIGTITYKGRDNLEKELGTYALIE